MVIWISRRSRAWVLIWMRLRLRNTGPNRVRFSLVLLLGFLSAVLRAQAADVAAILQRTAEKYSNLTSTSTSFRATTTLIDQNQRDAMTMEVAFRRPDKARLHVRGPGVGQAFGLPANELF